MHDMMVSLSDDIGSASTKRPMIASPRLGATRSSSSDRKNEGLPGGTLGGGVTRPAVGMARS